MGLVGIYWFCIYGYIVFRLEFCGYVGIKMMINWFVNFGVIIDIGGVEWWNVIGYVVDVYVECVLFLDVKFEMYVYVKDIGIEWDIKII